LPSVSGPRCDVELRRIYPLAFSMRTRRATNCAIAPPRPSRDAVPPRRAARNTLPARRARVPNRGAAGASLLRGVGVHAHAVVVEDADHLRGPGTRGRETVRDAGVEFGRLAAGERQLLLPSTSRSLPERT